MDTTDLSHAVWLSKYRLTSLEGVTESHIGETWRRVANAIAIAEERPEQWASRYEELLAGFRFLPGGRILANAGSTRDVTLFNCFVTGRLEDSLEGILAGLLESAQTMQQGGGVGIDFTPLRPAGTGTRRSGSRASGPVSFMALWDTLCATLLSSTARRGAMMGTLACDHPDIQAFIHAKSQPGQLTNFNLSVLVSDAFLQAVARDSDWPLYFPSRLLDGGGETAPVTSLPARTLWAGIAAAARASAEPGVLFIDTINRENNLAYCERISATNPCGEIPLPAHGCCDLGSINLPHFVKAPFTASSELDIDGICETAALAVRFLDDVIDVSGFPIDVQARQARQTRRIGLGITGLGDTLAMLGLRYSSCAGRGLAVRVLEAVRDTAYRTSVDLAGEKGAFPRFDAKKYLSAPFVSRLPGDIRQGIRRRGLRNSHLLSIAPAGTISLLAGNVSSGIEPIFALKATRGVRGLNGQVEEYEVCDHAWNLWLAGDYDEPARAAFETSAELTPGAHLEMLAALQPYVDNAISKTINLPATTTVEEVGNIFAAAHALGIKGCTVYREGASVGRVLGRRPDTHCCNLDREAD